MTKLVEWLSVALVGLALWLAAFTGSLQTGYRMELLWWVAGLKDCLFGWPTCTKLNNFAEIDCPTRFAGLLKQKEKSCDAVCVFVGHCVLSGYISY